MKVCIAGLSNLRKGTHSLLKEIPFVLESFYYIRDYEIPLIKSCELFLLDSGAFTFMNSKIKNADIDGYLEEYIKFINKHDVKYFFELDVDSIYGHEKVKEMRKRLEEGTGKKCIPVWHKSRGMDEWIRLTEEYDYVGFGSFAIEIKENEYKYIPSMLEIARKNKCKVHGLGFTSMKYIDKLHFYSADSTSWNCISRFGNLYKFDGKRIVNVTPKSKRINKKMYIDGEVHNLKEWIKFQRYADKKL